MSSAAHPVRIVSSLVGRQLLLDISRQPLAPEQNAFGFLDHLLVDRRGLDAHHHVTLPDGKHVSPTGFLGDVCDSQKAQCYERLLAPSFSSDTVNGRESRDLVLAKFKLRANFKGRRPKTQLTAVRGIMGRTQC